VDLLDLKHNVSINDSKHNLMGAMTRLVALKDPDITLMMYKSKVEQRDYPMAMGKMVSAPDLVIIDIFAENGTTNFSLTSSTLSATNTPILTRIRAFGKSIINASSSRSTFSPAHGQHSRMIDVKDTAQLYIKSFKNTVNADDDGSDSIKPLDLITVNDESRITHHSEDATVRVNRPGPIVQVLMSDTAGYERQGKNHNIHNLIGGITEFILSDSAVHNNTDDDCMHLAGGSTMYQQKLNGASQYNFKGRNNTSTTNTGTILHREINDEAIYKSNTTNSITTNVTISSRPLNTTMMSGNATLSRTSRSNTRECKVLQGISAIVHDIRDSANFFTISKFDTSSVQGGDCCTTNLSNTAQCDTSEFGCNQSAPNGAVRTVIQTDDSNSTVRQDSCMCSAQTGHRYDTTRAGPGSTLKVSSSNSNSETKGAGIQAVLGSGTASMNIAGTRFSRFDDNGGEPTLDLDSSSPGNTRLSVSTSGVEGGSSASAVRLRNILSTINSSKISNASSNHPAFEAFASEHEAFASIIENEHPDGTAVSLREGASKGAYASTMTGKIAVTGESGPEKSTFAFSKVTGQVKDLQSVNQTASLDVSTSTLFNVRNTVTGPNQYQEVQEVV